MKKIFAIVMTLVLVLGLLAGCGSDKKENKKDDDSANQAPIVDDGVISTDDVVFKDENGDSVYRIIRPDGGSLEDKVRSAATYIFTNMNSTLGFNIRNTVDSGDDGTDTYEILVGDTNRPETKIARDYLVAATGGFKTDYIIATIGKKIVIYSFDSTTLRTAAEAFVANFVKPEGVKGGIKSVFKSDVASNKAITINGAHISGFTVIRRHYNESYITQTQIEELIKVADNCGYRVEYADDAYVEEKAEAYEIIVGDANRTGVTEITANNDYSIKISGKKVFLNGSNPQSTAMAVAEFNKMIASGATLTDASSVEGNYETAIASYDKSKYYTRVWGDDFDGDSIDASKWYHVPESGYSSQGMNGRTSIRSSDPKYVYVKDGKFTIAASYTDTHYIGGMIMTDRTMLYKYGYLEMSAILPDGDGLWTSLWLDSRWHGYGEDEGAGYLYDFEIDVNECFGNATMVQANCHKWPNADGEAQGLEHTSLDQPQYSAKRHEIPEGNFSNEMHTFGLFWNQEVMSFTCDGKIYFTYEINKDPMDLDGFHTLAYLRLSAAIGFAGNPLGSVIPDDDPKWLTSNEFVIDYVHLYQIEDGVQQLVLMNK